MAPQPGNLAMPKAGSLAMPKPGNLAMPQPGGGTAGRQYWVGPNGKEINVPYGQKPPKNARHVVEGVTPGYPAGGVGGAASASGVPGLPPAPGGFSTNSAALDPRLTRQADRVEARLNDPEGSTGRAIDVATSKIRDANEGRAGAIHSRIAALNGGRAGGFEAAEQRNLAVQEGKDVAGSAADIALNRERDNDAFMLGATGALKAPGDAARSDRQIAQDAYNAQLNAWSIQQQNQRAAEAAAAQQYSTYLDAILRLGA